MVEQFPDYHGSLENMSIFRWRKSKFDAQLGWRWGMFSSDGASQKIHFITDVSYVLSILIFGGQQENNLPLSHQVSGILPQKGRDSFFLPGTTLAADGLLILQGVMNTFWCVVGPQHLPKSWPPWDLTHLNKTKGSSVSPVFCFNWTRVISLHRELQQMII